MIMAKRVTTLFIRDDAINLLVMDGNRVEKWASSTLEEGLVSQGHITDEVQVAEKLKDLFKLQNVTTGRVIAGLSGHNSVYRIITMPELPAAVLPEAVKREARRVIPVPLEEVYIAFQSLPTEKGETLIFLAAYPRDTTDALRRTLQQAGLQPYIMDLAPLALCRIVNEPRSIIVNARLDHLDIMVMIDRIPQVIRRLSIPGEDTALSERLPTIAEEIERTVAFYNSSHQERPLDSTIPMLVCGDLVEIPDSWPLLAGNSGFPVSILPSPVESPPGFRPNDFLVNIGLAYKELITEKEGDFFSLVNLNAVPVVYQPKPAYIKNIVIAIGATIAVGILILMWILADNKASHTDVLSSELEQVNIQISQLNAEIGSLQEQVQLLEPQVAELETTNAIFDNTLTSLRVVRDQVNGDLHQIASVLPGNINLTDVTHVGDEVTVSGRAQDEDDIFQYAINLRGSHRFSVVIISNIAWDEENEKFTFVFLLK